MPGKGNNLCKFPAARIALECSETGKPAGVTAVEGVRERVVDDEVRE